MARPPGPPRQPAGPLSRRQARGCDETGPLGAALRPTTSKPIHIEKQMSDYQTLGMVVGAVMIVAALLYVLDRRAKTQPVDYTDLGKITVGSGVLASGVLYSLGAETVADVAETVTAAAQDMFVGKPEF